jgi:hypothetical protein
MKKLKHAQPYTMSRKKDSVNAMVLEHHGSTLKTGMEEPRGRRKELIWWSDKRPGESFSPW